MVILRARITSYFILICLSVFGFGCDRQKQQPGYDETAVRNYVKPGLTQSELSARFGDPWLETTASDGSKVLIYHRPFVYVDGKERDADKEGFTGFKVYLQDNKVIRWDPITSGPTVR